MKLIWILVLVLLKVSFCQAGVLKDMQNFFNKFGAFTNSSSGSAFQDQSAGYMTGGSLFVRNPVHSQRILAATAPNYRAGCGGIDIWSGGFSYINAEGLKKAMQAIVSNVGSYAFMLAVETYAPQIHTIMQQLNHIAADFNRLNINSCEAAAGVLGGIWPKSDLGSQAVCRMVASHSGEVADWAKARHECGAGGRRDSLLARSSKDLLVGQFNLAWKVLGNLDFLLEGDGTSLDIFTSASTSTEERRLLKEIFMTLSGTVINRENKEGKEEQITFASRGDKEDFIKALMQGGRIEYYRCDEATKCLNPQLHTIDLRSDDSLQIKITKMLETISQKVRSDDGREEISKAEQSLINASHIPIYKILNVTIAHQKGRAPLNIVHHAELIAFDVAYKYINDVFDVFQDGINQLKAIQFTDVHFKPFIDGIRKARQHLMGYRMSAIAKMDLLLGFIQKTQLIERQLYTMLGSLSNEYGG